MDRTFLGTVLAAVVLLGAGVGAGIYLGGTGVFDERPRVDPSLTGFSTENATCTETPTENTTVDRATDDEGSSFLTLGRNVTVPDASHALNANFRREELANYTLSLRSVATDGPPETCPAGAVPQVRFRATVQVPHSLNETYGVTVVHDGERIATVRNGPRELVVRDVNRSG